MLRVVNFILFLFFSSLVLHNQAIAQNFDFNIEDTQFITQNSDYQKISDLSEKALEMLNSDLNKSLQYSREAYRLAEKTKVSTNIAVAAYSMANVHYVSRNYDSCFFYIKISENIFRKQQDDRELAKVFNTLGNYYKDHNIIDSAFIYFNQAVSIATRIGNDKILAVSYLNLGALHSNQLEDYVKAEEYTIRALDIIKKISDRSLENQAYYNLGIIRREIGDVITAEKYFLKVLDYYNEKNYHIKRINVYLTLGALFYSAENYAKSRSYFEKQLVLSKEKKYDSGMASAYHNIGSILYDTGKTDSAIIYFNYAKDINIRINYKSWLTNNYAQLASCYSDKEDYSMAHDYIQKALDIDKLIFDTVAIAESYNGLADIYRKRKMNDTAIFYYNKSTELAERFELDYLIAQNSRSLSGIYKEKGDFKTSLYLLEKSKTITDSLSSLEQISMLEELEIRYNVKNKDLEIEQNKTHIESLNQQNRNKKLQNTFLSILSFSVILFSLLILVIIRIRVKQRTDKMIFEKQILEKNVELNKIELQKATAEIHYLAKLIIQKNRIINEVKDEVLSTEKDKYDDNVKKMSKLLSSRIIMEEQWLDFKNKFEEVYPDFLTKMKIEFGKLTNNEIRLACLIKLNMSNKDIGEMLGVSTETVIKSKYRFKKKTDFTESTHLEEIIVGL